MLAGYLTLLVHIVENLLLFLEDAGSQVGDFEGDGEVLGPGLD